MRIYTHPRAMQAAMSKQESMHHIYVRSIKQVPPPFSVTKKKKREKREIDSQRGKCSILSVQPFEQT